LIKFKILRTGDQYGKNYKIISSDFQPGLREQLEGVHKMSHFPDIFWFMGMQIPRIREPRR
jgi:hypothetical protein